ncbi:hypothetical protein ACRAWD_22835 [Caulobacter segnis]
MSTDVGQASPRSMAQACSTSSKYHTVPGVDRDILVWIRFVRI